MTAQYSPEQYDGFMAVLEPLLSRMRQDLTAVMKRGADHPVPWEQPLTRQYLRSFLPGHMNGGAQFGCYHMLGGADVAGTTVMAATLDGDNHDRALSKAEVLALGCKVRDQFREHGWMGHLWTSRSGWGWHLHMLWEAPQDAYSVIRMADDVLAELGLKRGTGGLSAGEVEVYPKQPRVAPGKHGNLTFAPFAGQSQPVGENGELIPRESVVSAKGQSLYAWTMSTPVPFVEQPVRELRSAEEIRANLPELMRVLDALPNTPDDSLTYDEWRNVIFAIHYETGGSDEGLALAHAFSAKSPKYVQEFLDERVWPYVDDARENPVTIRSLYHMARPYGFVPHPAAEAAEFPMGEAARTPAAQELAKIDAGAANEVVDVVLGPDGPEAVTEAVRLRERALEEMHERLLESLEEWRDAAKGKPFHANDDRVCWFLTNACGPLQWELAFDAFRAEVVISEWGRGQWRPFRDEDYTEIAIAGNTKGFKDVPFAALKRAVWRTARLNPIDTAQVWLAGLQWDGVARVETFCSRYLRAKDTAYTRAVGRYIWTALAGRVMVPGIKADMVPIFVSEQGTRKTSTIMAIAPAPAHFCKVNLAEKDADLFRRMKGKLVAEIAEMRGLRGRDQEAIRDFISAQSDEWVMKYSEMTYVNHRRLLMFGTANDPEILADDFGERRWLPFDVGVADIEQLRADCHQLWAEGRALFAQSGIEFAAAERLARDEHAEYKVTDAWDADIADWMAEELDTPDKRALSLRHPDFVTTGDVAVKALGLRPRDVKPDVVRRIGSALRRLGFAYTKHGPGKRCNGMRGWWLPGAETSKEGE